ncbi:MAG TPA: efflux RND transporter periplasmic adaptor subunit [Saprospiraceae bacterium]|nr:efflux RND transporter periplasmic adaptor subunit [Saprospiraceae bacterium]
MNSFQNILYALGAGSLIFLTACKGNDGQDPTKEGEAVEVHMHEEGGAMEVALTSDQYKIAGIETNKVEIRNLTGLVHVNGELDVPPQNLQSISAPAAGFLKSSDLLQGSRVYKGQAIAVIRNPEFIQWQQDYLETVNQLEADRSHLEYLESEYRRQEELAKENINATKTLQSAKAEYHSMKSSIAGLEARLGGQSARLQLLGINPQLLKPDNYFSEITIFSPTSGYVMAVNVNAGKYISNTDVLFQIADTKHLHAELTVFEKDILKLKVGQKVRFTLANETRERTATIFLFGREISEDRGIRVHCHLDKEDIELLPGMYFKAVVETGASPVPSVPEAAIVSSEGKDYIFVVEKAVEPEAEMKEEKMSDIDKEVHEEGQEKGEHHADQHFKMVEVKKGLTDETFVEVILPQDFDIANNLVVTKGAFYLLSAFKSASEGEEGHAH